MNQKMVPGNKRQSKIVPGVWSVGPIFVAAVLLFFGFNFKNILYHNLGEVELHKAVLGTSNLETHLRAAEGAFQKALKKDPNRAESWLGLGKVYCLQRRYQEAERALETYKDLRSGDPYIVDWLIAQGQKRAEQGQHEDAEETARLTFAVSAKTAAGYFALGEIYTKMARWEEAFSAYQKAVEREPRHIPAYSGLCWAQLKLGKRQKAIACYQELAKIGSESDRYYAYLNLGNIYGVWCRRKKCDYELALTYFRQMFAVAGDRNKKAEYYALSGYVYYRQGELPEAIARLEKAIALRPDYSRYHLRLAGAYRDDGQLEKALAEYQKVLELHPKNEYARQEVEKLLRKEES